MQRELIIDDSNWQQHAQYVPPNMSRGREARDFAKVPLGSMGFAAKLDLPLIPRSQWSARIADMERSKSRLSDIVLAAGVPSLDQNGTNYCHTPDTEVLTEKGWRRWDEYNWTDLLGTMNPADGMLEFQPCLVPHIYEHTGQVICSTNRAVDFAVTPDHRMLVRKWDERRRTLADKFTFQRAGDIGWYAGLPHATTGHRGLDLEQVSLDGDRVYNGDDFAALLSLVISDGYAGSTEKTKSWVSFACFTERRKAVAEIAARCGFHEQPSRPGVWIRYGAHVLAEYIRANCYTSAPYRSHNKCIPIIVKAMSSRQIRHFLDFYGDQSHTMQGAPDKGNAYFSTSKRCIDDLQELLLRVGKRGSVWSEDRAGKQATLENGQMATSQHRMHHLHERAEDRLCIDRKKHIEQESYSGQVYCATVPNGTLVTRRNGTMLISGNCWCNAVITAIETVRCVMNEPYVKLSPASVAAPIKGYRNQGGWGGEALEYIVEHGVAAATIWPPNAIDRSKKTSEADANAALHKVTEWYDLESGNFDQVMTCLLLRIPVPIGLNWWSHEVCAMDPVEISPGKYGARIRNSWGDSYGEKGFAVLSESKATPDDACAPRVTLPSTT